MGEKNGSVPALSIVIPVVDRSAYLLSLTLDSIFSQDFGSMEVVIIDGTKHGLMLDKVKIFRAESSQLFSMVNEGVARATGEYVNFLNPGEFYISHHVLSMVSKFIKGFSKPDLVYSGCLVRHRFGLPTVFMKQIDMKDFKAADVPAALRPYWFRLETLRMLGKFQENFEFQGGLEVLCRFYRSSDLKKVFLKRVLTDYEYRRPQTREVLNQFLETLSITVSNFGVTLSLFGWIGKNVSRGSKWMKSIIKRAFWRVDKACLMLLVPGALWGSSPHRPQAGVLERQIESEYEAKPLEPEKEIPFLEIEIPEKEFNMGDETVFVKSFIVSGHTVLSEKMLTQIVKPYEGRDLSMKEIHELCLEIQKKYTEEGYFLARVYIPAQNVLKNELRVVVIEGRLGKLSVVGNKHYSEKFIKSYFRRFEGESLNYDQFLKALLLLNENSDLRAGAIFKKGVEFGTADVVIQVEDANPLHLTFDHNNYGSTQTSLQRTGGKFEWGNAITYGDMVTLIEVVGQSIARLNFSDIIYHLPINRRGSFFDASYLFANFKTGKQNDIKFTGHSHIASVKLSQALNRTRKLNTDIYLSFDYKQIQNWGGGIQSSYDKLRVLTPGFDLDYIDALKGRNLFNIYMGIGIPNLFGGNNPVSSQSSRYGGGGQFVRINSGYKRLQRIPYDCFLIMNIFTQYSPTKLPLPEQIYIGGIDTVRGYPLAEALGDSGLYANVEFRVPPPWIRDMTLPGSNKRWGEFLQVAGFFDMGQTWTVGFDQLREIVETSNGKKRRARVRQTGRANLNSAGCGIRIFGPWKFEASMDIGWPLTEKHCSSNTIVYYRVAWNIF